MKAGPAEEKTPFTFAKATIQGRAGRDPELRYTSGGKKVASFSLAVGGGRKKDSAERWPTYWFNVTAWDEQADIAESVRKGATVQVKGRLSFDEWLDRNTGEKRSRLVVTSTAIEFVDEEAAPPKQQLSPIDISDVF